MAALRSGQVVGSVWWRRRPLEWGLLVLVVLGAVFGMEQQTRALQAQAELAAIQSTLGSLRTSLVIDHLQKAVRGQPPEAAAVQFNPFMVLRVVPGNFAGEVAGSDLASMAPGSWFFDPFCKCIGYRPMYPQWLTPQVDPPVLWYRVDGAPGPLQITALEDYVWQGQRVN